MSDIKGPPAPGTIERLVDDAVDSGAVALAHRRDGKLAGVDLDAFDKSAGEHRAALLAEVERLHAVKWPALQEEIKRVDEKARNLAAEVERLKVEASGLRAALVEACDVAMARSGPHDEVGRIDRLRKQAERPDAAAVDDDPRKTPTKGWEAP